ncbi:hypothetical protein ABZ863_22575 [Saccharomonospora sp. NPDC046836]|uniref:hypothetical protein n=1 Tax=Saccharomonospora sp. NPDC046836 TaxID=3156921 RepID=UPI0033F93F75
MTTGAYRWLTTAPCEGLIRSLPITHPCDLSALIVDLAEQCGRRIRLLPAELGEENRCGLLLSASWLRLPRTAG